MHTIIQQHKLGTGAGICSVCSAHPLVIEAALRLGLAGEEKVLIEATSNQVNQDGGYTGMNPAQFRDYVLNIARSVGFPAARLILGGDHLGPNCWQDQPAEQAMAKSRELIAAYVSAGFSKIHLDASMSCADDPQPLPPETVAQRAAELCRVAEQSAGSEQRAALCYVIGTEVPVPGGESSTIEGMHVTRAEDAAQTLALHHQAFTAAGVPEAISRIVAMVVQPGVEFDHSSVIAYQPEKTAALKAFIASTPLVYEAHSTDYQTREAYRALVNDHFAILKVGPALTFALREAIFALASIERELIVPEKQSQALAVIDQVMLDQPGYWKKYYGPGFSRSLIDLHYSLSDRIRYYWPNARISQALVTLSANLSATPIPAGMLSQFLPRQYLRVQHGVLRPEPQALIIDKIQDVLRDYAWGCQPRHTRNQELSHA